MRTPYLRVNADSDFSSDLPIGVYPLDQEEEEIRWWGTLEIPLTCWEFVICELFTTT